MDRLRSALDVDFTGASMCVHSDWNADCYVSLGLNRAFGKNKRESQDSSMSSAAPRPRRTVDDENVQLNSVVRGGIY